MYNTAYLAQPAPRIAAMFPKGVAAFEAQGPCTTDLLFNTELSSIAHAVESRVNEFVLGRVCARAALAELGLPPTPIPTDKNRAPVWPTGFTGSISHTNGYCVAVVGKVKQVNQKTGITAIGLDIEKIGQVLPEIWPSVMVENEISLLKSLEAKNREVFSTVIFSAKEAFYKAQYQLTQDWVDFCDATIDLFTDSFTVNLRNTELPIAGQALSFKGRYMISKNQVITAFSI